MGVNSDVSCFVESLLQKLESVKVILNVSPKFGKIRLVIPSQMSPSHADTGYLSPFKAVVIQVIVIINIDNSV